MDIEKLRAMTDRVEEAGLADIAEAFREALDEIAGGPTPEAASDPTRAAAEAASAFIFNSWAAAPAEQSLKHARQIFRSRDRIDLLLKAMKMRKEVRISLRPAFAGSRENTFALPPDITRRQLADAIESMLPAAWDEAEAFVGRNRYASPLRA